MLRRLMWIAVVVLATAKAPAQGLLGDVFTGKLINPEVGAWAWYELTDKATGAKFFLRQAIVGAEEVKRKPGFWVETELAPTEGFPTIFKMLLTGPASDSKNVHQLIIKEGADPAESVPVPQEGYTSESNGVRSLVGKEKLKIGSGEEVEAEHFTVGVGDAKADVWVNEAVRPLGIVKMSSAEGDLLLQRFGLGGNDAQSVINAYAEDAGKGDGNSGKVRVEVRVNGEKQETPSAKKKDMPTEATPAAKPADKPKPAKKSKPKE